LRVLESRFQFSLVVAGPSGYVIHREVVRDFQPCYEDLLFSGVIGGVVPNDGRLPPARLEPLWRGEAGGRVARVTVDLPPLQKAYRIAIFRAHVWALLVEQKFLGGETGPDYRFSWWLEAAPEGAPARAGRFRASLARQPYPIRPRPLSDFGIERRPGAEQGVGFYVRQDVLAALRGETARALGAERADILTGHVVQELAGQVAVMVTGRAPAVAGAVSSRTQFTFSPLTFLAARQALAGGAHGSTIVGWHHSHPPPCGRPCLFNIPPCGTGMLFFSPEDHAVHRASFPAPYMIALVSGKEAGRRADDPGVRAYGWRDGAIVEREFTVF
jgi:hypothetical protein